MVELSLCVSHLAGALDPPDTNASPAVPGSISLPKYISPEFCIDVAGSIRYGTLCLTLTLPLLCQGQYHYLNIFLLNFV